MKILVIDDDLDNLNMLREVLKRQHEVLTATKGSDGLKVLSENLDTHILITDRQMPEMDGVQVIAWAKTIVPNIRACLMSGAMDDYSRMSAIRAGAERTLNKPFSVTELREWVNGQKAP